ncbi:Flap endonuclease GEN-like 1 [Linum grandiflorum]
MGVAGKFWDLLKPYARHEDPDFLRDKKVAVDLSYWIVQHDTAIKTYSLNPHLRLTFFRTLNLFSKFGAFPVFVADGTPSPLKSQARIARFFRSSGIDASQWPVAEEGVSVERNGAFLKCVKDCVELIELFGMPVLKAKGEAEALCAQLNLDGHVDACITADSDAFLFGAQCVIKSIKPNAKEPFECYLMSDIEAGLGLKREHLIAISLLVGNDHDLTGVQGIGIDNALRFVQKFGADEILDKLREIGSGSVPKVLNSPMLSPGDDPCISWQNPETDMLVDFLVIHQHWEPSYVRQRMLPMLSTIYLRDTAERTAKSLLNGQFEFDCIQRIKIRSGHQSFVVKWRRAGSKQTDAHQHEEQDEIIEIDEISDGLDDEWEEPAMIHVDHEGQFVSTDENMELVRAAFPDQVKEFLLAKELKESKRKRPKSGVASDKSKGVQLTITEFYRSNKAQVSDKQGEASKPSPDEEDKEIQTTSTSPLSKSARRRLLFE